MQAGDHLHIRHTNTCFETVSPFGLLQNDTVFYASSMGKRCLK